MRKTTIAVLIILAASMIIAPQTNSTSDVDSFNAWRPGADGLGCHTLIGSANLPTTGDILFDQPVYVVNPGEAFKVTSWIEGYGADLSGDSGNDLIIGYNILDGDNVLFTPVTVSLGNFPMASGNSVGEYEQDFVAPKEHGTYYLHSYAVGGDPTFFAYIHDFATVIVTDGYDTTDVVEDLVQQYVVLAENGVSDGLKWVETNKTGDEVYKSGQTKGTAAVGNLMLDIYEDRVRSSLLMGLNTEDFDTPLALAIGAGDWLISLKSSDGNGGSYWYEVYYANETSNNGVIAHSFYGGVSGIVSYLARLYRITHDAAYLTAAEEGLTYLINENTAELTPTGNTYTPVVGGYAWTEKGGQDANLTSTRWSKGGPGIGAVFLEVYRMTGNQLYYDVAYGHYLFLEATKETDADGDFWYKSIGDPLAGVYLGRWHGMAGVASFLIDLYQVNDKVEVMTLITSSLDWLIANGDSDGNGGLMFENKLGGGEYQNGWSRGGAGIGSVLLRAHELDGTAGYLTLVYDIYTHYENVAVTLGDGWGFSDSNFASKIYVGMGHGGSGIGLFMLGAYQATGDVMFLEGAQGVALGLDSMSFIGDNGITWFKSTTDLYVDNYIYYGIGGVAKFFLSYDSMGDYTALQTAIDATDYVLSTGVVENNGLKFPEKVGATDPIYKTGVLKGAPGNALQFMNLYQRLSTDLPFFGLTTNATYQYLDAAEEAMIWMESVAMPVEGGIAWYEALYENGSAAINDIHGAYYAGAAGVADIFTRLSQSTGNQTYMDIAEDAADFLINSAITTTGYAWTEAYADFTNATLISTRWTFGTPGVGDFFINMYQQTGNATYLTVATGAATYLDSVKITETDGFSWYRFANDPTSGVYLGRWHGSAGIATFLINLYVETGNVVYLNQALDAMEYVESQAVITGDTVKWENKRGGGEYQNGFSRGSAGIGSVMNRLFRLTDDLGYLDYIDMIINHYVENAIESSSGWGWPDSNFASKIYAANGHGVAGIVNFAAEVYQTTHNPAAYEVMAMGMNYLFDNAIAVGNDLAWDKSTTDQYIDTTMYYGVSGVAFAAIEASHFFNLAPVLTGSVSVASETDVTFDFAISEDIGISYVTIEIDGTTTEIPAYASYLYDASSLIDGTYTATITVYDVGGLEDSITVNFVIDTAVTTTVDPTVTITVTGPTETGPTVTVTGPTTTLPGSTETETSTKTESPISMLPIIAALFSVIGIVMLRRRR